jgi:Mn2+/Fe2+ NRAMP family transporter
MIVITTLLGCIIVAIAVFVIVLDRRIRGFVMYSTQMIVPSTFLIASSKWYNLFSIPPHLARSGCGSLTFSATGFSTECTDICVTLHGAGSGPTILYDSSAVTEFELEQVIEFVVDPVDRGKVISLRIETSNPGTYIRMSDIIVTFSIH